MAWHHMWTDKRRQEVCSLSLLVVWVSVCSTEQRAKVAILLWVFPKQTVVILYSGISTALITSTVSDLSLLWLPAQHWLSRVQYSTYLFPLLTIHSSLLPIFSVLSICNCSFHIFFKICYKNFPQILFVWWSHFTSSSVYFFRELCYNWYGKIYLFFSFPFLFFSLYISIWIPTPSPPLNLPPHPLIHPSERVRHVALQ